MNVRLVAGIEFEDRPHRRAHLLALHVSGISGDTQSARAQTEGCDDCVISAGATTRFLVVRHATTLVLSEKTSKPLSFRHGRFSAVETHRFVFLASLTGCLDSYFLILNSYFLLTPHVCWTL